MSVSASTFRPAATTSSAGTQPPVADGMRIDATWVGQPVEGRCGPEIRGTRRRATSDEHRGFTLRRVQGD